MITTATLGFPRIGPQRELKRALEAHWAGVSDAAALERAAADLRRSRWLRQKHHGVAVVPSNDFSLYDHVLDTACLVGAVPARFAHPGGAVDHATYFRMARGAPGVAALEMTKWFDTNYHYLVPELSAATRFAAEPGKPLAEFREALALGLATRPVLLGPVSFLLLAKRSDGGAALDLLPRLLPAYLAVLTALADAGAQWLQLDEPCLVTDIDASASAAYRHAYGVLAGADPRLRLMLTTYFGGLEDNLALACALPVHGLHLDLVRAPGQLDAALAAAPAELLLSLGVVDGRNVWRADLDAALGLVRRAVARRGAERLQLAPSCSLLHVPVDLGSERGLDPRCAGWLAFATQKLDELGALALAEAAGDAAIAGPLAASRQARAERSGSALARVPAVRERVARVAPGDLARRSRFAERAPAQHRRLGLPPLPTTTIGSFPQTAEVRSARAAFKAGRSGRAEYDAFLRAETVRCLRRQEEAGLDVLVHGEFERNDMVEYFAEDLAGFAITGHGWVQSYGSRCVKPPLIVGDVHRPVALTVAWTRFAQAQTVRPVKGMLTGPVTILQWSFVRDDLPRRQVCAQIALALRDELADLELAGTAIIQVDEPAFREGLPLRRREAADYLRWAAECFRLATSAVRDDTQIHTHMCYSEFNDIVASIAALDADVISIETARSRMELLDAFARDGYPNEIGPGIYDIHAPAVPTAGEMAALLRRACRTLRPGQVWVNPDCGLKTRRWTEVEPALRNLVAAARQVRAELAGGAPSAGAATG